MSLLAIANESTKEQLEAAGRESAAIKEAGAHEVTIKSVYDTEADTWKSLTVEFETVTGETIKISEFYGMPKDDSSEAKEKADKATNRLVSMISRLGKAAGIPDIKAGTTGAQEGTDAKGRKTTTYPKYAKKKMYIITFTSIDGDKRDLSKVYVKQEVDTSKFLTKDGKDQLGRDCKESFDAAAKERAEIAYGFENNPAHITKLAQVREKMSGVAAPQQQQTTPPPAQNLDSMPSADQTEAPTTTPVVEADDDI